MLDTLEGETEHPGRQTPVQQPADRMTRRIECLTRNRDDIGEYLDVLK
ncbi:hypothetical protein ACFWIQ_12435 [Kitasatospora sp. NPDC127059]